MTTHIQIGDTRPRIQYLGDGAQTVFPYPFAIFREADLAVYLDDDAVTGGVSISGAGGSDGGAVTFAVAPATGRRVTLLRRLTIARATDFQAGGALRAAVLNDELDHLTAVDQQLDEALSRAVTVPPTARDGVVATLPSPEPGAVIGWNETATALVNDPQNYGSISDALATITAAADAGAEALGHAHRAERWAKDAALSVWMAALDSGGADGDYPGPGDAVLCASLVTTGDVTVGGNLVVNGSSVTVDAETVLVADTMVILNHGEVGAGVTQGVAGVEVDRGTAAGYRFVFRESDDTFVIGESGGEQPVATRQDTPTANAVPFWNAAANRLDSVPALTWDGAALTLPAAIAYDQASFKVSAASVGASATIALADGEVQALTLTANTVVTLPDPPAGRGYAITLKLIQDGTGTRTPSFQKADATAARWLGGAAPTWQTAAGAIDVVVLTQDGTDLIAAHAGGAA